MGETRSIPPARDDRLGDSMQACGIPQSRKAAPPCKTDAATSSTPQAGYLSVPAKVTPPASTGTRLFPGLKAALAIHGTVPPGLERHCGLLSAPGADDGCTPRFTALVSSAGLFLFLGLTALLAALRRRISALAEERLIVNGKRERLSAIATNEFLIPSHISSLSFMLQVCVAFEMYRTDDLRWLLKIGPPNRAFPAVAVSNELCQNR